MGTGPPLGLVTQVEDTLASGAITVRRFSDVLPSSQALQPGRRALTTIVTLVPGAIFVLGVSTPPALVIAIARPSASLAVGGCKFPPSACRSTRASATGSAVSVTPENSSNAVSASATTATNAKPTKTGQRGRRRFGELLRAAGGEASPRANLSKSTQVG